MGVGGAETAKFVKVSSSKVPHYKIYLWATKQQLTSVSEFCLLYCWDSNFSNMSLRFLEITSIASQPM